MENSHQQNQTNFIEFVQLCEMHFPLLLKWLESPHVKSWWDPDTRWDSKKIYEKYETYVKGYKIETGIKKRIQAYIILYNQIPIGYIQLYNAYDFPRIPPLKNLPKSLAAFDLYIGEATYLGKGIGGKALSQFIAQYVDPCYEFVFADPDAANLAAINTYSKAGLQQWNFQPDKSVIWMLLDRRSHH